MRRLLSLVILLGVSALGLAQDRVEPLPASELAKVQVSLRSYYPYRDKPAQGGKAWCGMGITLWNQSTYEITEVVYEAQVFDAGVRKIALKRDIVFKPPFSDSENGYQGSLLPWQESKVYSPAFLVDANLVNRSYWGVLKSAKGYRKAKDLTDIHHFFAEVARGDLKSVKAVIERDPSFALKSEPRSGVSALHIAVTDDQMDLVKYLVEQRHVDPNLPNKWKMEPIHMAAWANSVQAIPYLLKKGVSPDRQYSGYYPVHCAAMRDSIDAYKILIAAGAKINPRGPNGVTPMHNAARYSPTVLKFLLDKKVSPNLPECTVGTPLHLSIEEVYKPQLTQMLLKAGADPNAFRNSQVKWTPLHSAIQKGNAYVVEMLLNAGASVTIKGVEGDALAVAKRHSPQLIPMIEARLKK